MLTDTKIRMAEELADLHQRYRGCQQDQRTTVSKQHDHFETIEVIMLHHIPATCRLKLYTPVVIMVMHRFPSKQLGKYLELIRVKSEHQVTSSKFVTYDIFREL